MFWLNKNCHLRWRFTLSMKQDLYALGRTHQTQNNFGPARETFKKLIALKLKYFRAYNNLVLCYEAVWKIAEADAMFGKAEHATAEANPRDGWPYAIKPTSSRNKSKPMKHWSTSGKRFKLIRAQRRISGSWERRCWKKQSWGG